jgi:hypothetical protein
LIEVVAELVLVGIILVQQYHIHILINKLASRNFYDYKVTEAVGKPQETVKEPPVPEMEEDLGTLSGIV